MSQNQSTKSNWLLPVVLLAAIGAAAWYFLSAKATPPVVVPAVTTPVASKTPEPVEPQDVLTAKPVEQDPLAEQAADAGDDTAIGDEQTVATTETLPPLDSSDELVKDGLLSIKWQPGLATLFANDELIRRFVVQVDNIAQGRLVPEQALFKGMKQDFKAKAVGQGYQLDAANYARYDRYLTLLESADPKAVAAVFQRFYPLMQSAYEELGYPNAQFKQRVQQAIQVLLDSPEVADEPELVLPSVHYAFADSALEQKGLAHKQMIRLGQKNQQRMKLLLQRYQPLLTR
jgi:hypothetical protein